MKYGNVTEGVFLERPNRFIARVLVDGREETAHVKNTGRCREILKYGTPVFLELHSNPARKTRFSLISAYKGKTLVNIDSQVPNQLVYDAIQEGRIRGLEHCTCVKREVPFGNSRFDLYYETPTQKGYIEVKGVTLEDNRIALFPDAPTERGTKHLLELASAAQQGYTCYVVFVIQMKGISLFKPNQAMDPAFSKNLAHISARGVQVLAYDCRVSGDEIRLDHPTAVLL